MPEETAPHRLKRLKMRSMRRGIKEMDLILSAYADSALALMDEARLDTYDRMLNENDHDLYQWVSGQGEAPEAYAATVRDIRRHIAATRVV